jgi:prepilin-type N-terminal cleavage/methylation domain-containing protein
MKKDKRGGFTLVEVLIVIVILAILSYISITYIKGEIEKSKITTDIKTIYALLQEGREKAFSHKLEIDFVLDVANKKVCLKDPTDGKIIICKSLNSSDYSSTTNPIKIDKRGTFTNGTIYYTGSLKNLAYSCISISNLRVKMGVWDGNECKVK